MVKVEAVEENKSCLTATLLASDLRLAAALPTCFARRDRSHNIRTDEGEQQIERFLGNKLPWFSFLDECQRLNLSSVCQEIASCDGHKIFSSFLNPRPYKGENTLFLIILLKMILLLDESSNQKGIKSGQRRHLAFKKKFVPLL